MAAADVVVLKVQPLGGVRACLALAGDIGLPVVVSSALESSVGIAAGVALAAALPDLPFACGLATTALLGGDLVRNPATVVDGAVAVDVPTIDDDALDRHRADPETHRRWLDRIAACERVLGEPVRGPS
jgi:O-succinylbenzoate synthase